MKNMKLSDLQGMITGATLGLLRNKAWKLYQAGHSTGAKGDPSPDFTSFKLKYYNALKDRIAMRITGGQIARVNEAYYEHFKDAYEDGKAGKPLLSRKEYDEVWTRA